MTDETKEVLQAVQEMFRDLKQDINAVNERVGKVESSLKDDIKEVKNRVIKMETTFENETNKNIKLLAEGFGVVSNKIQVLDEIKDDVLKIKDDVDVMKRAIITHSTEITKLSKAK